MLDCLLLFSFTPSPLASLLQVFGDDPFTPVVEPSIPFTLGVLIFNSGAGTAQNLAIASSQPQIVENSKGLLISFKIISSEVNYQQINPSLSVALGDLAPHTPTAARWYLLSSLQGFFENFNASYQYTTPLGDSRLSVLESLSIHSLTQVVRDTIHEDGVPDFLADDIPDLYNYPDTLHSSFNNSVYNVSVVGPTGAVTGSPVFHTQGFTITVTLDPGYASTGWLYVRLNDPVPTTVTLSGVERGVNTGDFLEADNVWRTDYTARYLGGTQIQDWTHLFDFNSTGVYTLHYQGVFPVTNLQVRESERKKEGKRKQGESKRKRED